jgi:hypothetical protein
MTRAIMAIHTLDLGVFAKQAVFRLHLPNGPTQLRRRACLKKREFDEMKWTVAGAGALLCAAGVYALIDGSSIIQVERGWATFIAGAVLLGAGVIVIGIAALMGRIDRLTNLLRTAMTPAGAPWTNEPEAAGQHLPDIHDAPPPPREVAAAPPPALERLRAEEPAAPVFQTAPAFQAYPQREQAPPAFQASPPASQAPPQREQGPPAFQARPAFQAPPQREPVRQERPAALRDFQFVFPPSELSPAPPAAAEAPAAFEAPADVPPAQVSPLEKPAYGRPARMEWLRRGKTEAAPEPEPVPEEPAPVDEIHAEYVAASAPVLEASEPVIAIETQPEPEAEVVAEAQPEPVIEETPEPEAPEPEAPELRAAEQEAPEPEEPEQAPREQAPPERAPAPTLDPFTSDWLERALAGADEEDVPTVRLSRRTSVSTIQAVQSDEPAPEAAPSKHEAEPAAEAPTDAPVEIGRYRANDVAYVMFSDGSITAETPAGGSYRFNSLPELRAFIERGGV